MKHYSNLITKELRACTTINNNQKIWFWCGLLRISALLKQANVGHPSVFASLHLKTQCVTALYIMHETLDTGVYINWASGPWRSIQKRRWDSASKNHFYSPAGVFQKRYAKYVLYKKRKAIKVCTAWPNILSSRTSILCCHRCFSKMAYVSINFVLGILYCVWNRKWKTYLWMNVWVDYSPCWSMHNSSFPVEKPVRFMQDGVCMIFSEIGLSMIDICYLHCWGKRSWQVSSTKRKTNQVDWLVWALWSIR